MTAQLAAALHHLINLLEGLTCQHCTHVHLALLQAINSFIGSWIHNTSNAVLLDLNAVSHASPIKAPQAKSGDIHYQCEYMNHYNQPREPCIRTNTHGGCTDTFNTMMVQLVLNHICNREMQGKPGSLA